MSEDIGPLYLTRDAEDNLVSIRGEIGFVEIDDAFPDEDPDEQQEQLCFACSKPLEFGEISVCDEHYKGLWWLTVYSLTRGYGGPEEGGWWYDVGMVLCNVPLESKDEAFASRDKYVKMFKDHGYKDQYSRYSVMNGNDLQARIGREQGENFPQHRPHYE